MLSSAKSVDRETGGRNPQESNHSGNEPTPEQMNATNNIGDRKPKIKWPKANETAVYKKFDEDVNKLLMRSKGTTEEKLEKLATTIYEEGKKQFGLEAEKKKEAGKKQWTSRRQEKIREVKKEKKRLRTLWIQATEDEKEGLMVLYEEVKKKHRQLMRDERRAVRNKERKRSRKE